jgi:hypothetical protein
VLEKDGSGAGAIDADEGVVVEVPARALPSHAPCFTTMYKNGSLTRTLMGPAATKTDGTWTTVCTAGECSSSIETESATCFGGPSWCFRAMASW